ncbi:MAG: GPW/gp25 family protein [Acinetobacter sp.]|uniref:GPW/gp25 family protein n=1 Tax=Acinetobacter sp. TaxID=472 RepID=UPI00391A87CC
MMSRYTGAEIAELEHIRESLEDIATTPIGSRVMRRNYGTLLFNLIDQPIGEALYLRIYSTLYTAYVRWENRIEISQIQVVALNKGQLILDIVGFLKSSGSEVNMSIPVNLGAL